MSLKVAISLEGHTARWSCIYSLKGNEQGLKSNSAATLLTKKKLWKWMFCKEAQNWGCRATVNIVVAAKIREDQTAGALVNWFTALLWITLSISIVYRSEALAWFIVLTRVIHVVYLRRPSMPILRPSFDAWVDLLMLSCLCQKHRQHHYQQSETNRMSL